MAGQIVETGELKFDGPEAENHSIPAEVLVSTLTRIQRLVQIMAAAEEGVDMRRRFKPTAALRAAHEIRCRVPVSGSLSIPILEVNNIPEDGVMPFSGLGKLDQFVEAVAAGDLGKASRLVPATELRARAMQDLEELSPGEGANWHLLFHVKGRSSRFVDYGFGRRVGAMRRQRGGAEESGHVIGTLQRMNFADHRLKILHSGTQVSIECNYPAELEDSLFEDRLAPVCLRGEVRRNENGDVVGISGEPMIEAVDLAAFDLGFIEFDGMKLRLNPPLAVRPEFDQAEKQYLVFDNEALGIHIAAPTRKELMDELIIHIGIAWREYGLASDDELSPSGLRLKIHLRKMITQES